MHVISVQCVTLWSCSHILREMFHSDNFRVNSLFLCVVLGALLHSINTYMILFLFYKHIFDIYIFFCFSDQKFLISSEFLWKVVVITLVSCLPLYILKYLRRKYAPPSYSKLTN